MNEVFMTSPVIKSKDNIEHKYSILKKKLRKQKELTEKYVCDYQELQKMIE